MSDYDERVHGEAGILAHLHEIFWRDSFVCGCGDPDAAYDLVWLIVKWFEQKDAHDDAQIAAAIGEDGGPIDRVSAVLALGKAGQWKPYEPSLDEILPHPGVRQIVIGAVGNLDLIDHGSSYYSSWLTEKGKWLLWAVEQIGGIEDLSEKWEHVGFPRHENDGPCTAKCWKIPCDDTPSSGGQTTAV